MNEQAKREQLESEVRNALHSLRAPEFAAGFEDRVMQRWRQERTNAESTQALIVQRAWRFVPVALAASLLLGVWSASTRNPSVSQAGSVVTRALGWQRDTNSGQRATFQSLYATVYNMPQLNSTQRAQ